MKKFIFVFLFFLCLSFNMFIVPSMATVSVNKRGIYTIESLNLSPNTMYTVQNLSFNDRIYMIIIDSNQNIIQTIRLWPQSQAYNFGPLQVGYRIVLVGDGEVTIS